MHHKLMFNAKRTNFSKGQILLTRRVGLKLDQTFFELDKIGSNFLCLGWNWIKPSLPWMKLDQTFFALDEIGSNLLELGWN